MKKYFFFLLFIVLFFISCAASPRQITIKHILSQKKTTTYYKDYRRIFFLEVLYFDWDLRQQFSQSYSKNYFLDKEQILAEQKKEYQEKYYFFAFTSFQEIPSNLEKKNSSWKFFLKDWNNDNYLPVTIKELSKKDLYYQFITEHAPLDNWTELYILEASRDFFIAPKENLTLQMSGLHGKVQLHWEKSDPFFSNL